MDRANVQNLLYASQDVIGLLSDSSSPERRELTTAWGSALDRVSAGQGDDALSAADQLKLLQGARDAGAARRTGCAAVAGTAGPDPPGRGTRRFTGRPIPMRRQAAINAAANLYFTAGMGEDANRLLVAELGKTKSPYYFMLDLADIAEKAGRKDEAVQWLGQAYAGAQGPATRFQWGYNYLVGLLEMTPEDAKTIETRRPAGDRRTRRATRTRSTSARDCDSTS